LAHKSSRYPRWINQIEIQMISKCIYNTGG
jgi:hypothetical protein